jgi:carbonic anhydrase
LSVADELLLANEQFVKNFNLGDLAVQPKRRLAVLACMDSRILFERCLGLKPGGLLRVKEYELRAHLTSKMNAIASEPAHFYAFDDLEANLREQVRKVKSHPWIPNHIPVRGFIYDVKTGKLAEVE